MDEGCLDAPAFVTGASSELHASESLHGALQVPEEVGDPSGTGHMMSAAAVQLLDTSVLIPVGLTHLVVTEVVIVWGSWGSLCGWAGGSGW